MKDAQVNLAQTIEYKRVAELLGQAAMILVLLANIVAHPAVVLLLCSAVAGLLFIHERPTAGIWLIVILTPIETIGPLSFTVTKYAKIALTALVAIALCADGWATKSGQAKDPYRWAFFLILFSAIPATLLASSPLNSAMGVMSLVIFVVYYTGVRRSKELLSQAPRLLHAVLAGALLISLVCISQMTYGYSGVFGSAEQQSVDAEQSYDTMWPTIVRASGTFNGPTAAGAFAAIGVIVAVTHVLAFRKFRLAYCLAVLLCAIGVLTTFSRGALLGAITGCVFASLLLIRWPRLRLLTIAACLFGVVASVLVSEQVRSYLRIGTDIVSTSPSRVDAWHAAATLVRRNPVFGIGFYEFHTASQGISGTSETPLHPHNGALKMLVEQGPVGLLGYGILVSTFLYVARNTVRDAIEVRDRWVLGSIAGIGAGLFTQELFDAGFTTGNSSIAILFATLLGLQASLHCRLHETFTKVSLNSRSVVQDT